MPSDSPELARFRRLVRLAVVWKVAALLGTIIALFLLAGGRL